MPLIVAQPIVPFLRSRRAYPKKHGDRAPQKVNKRASGDVGAHSYRATVSVRHGRPRNAFRARACRIVMTKFSGHAVISEARQRSLDTPMPRSTSTRTLSGKPPSAMCSAAMLLGLYRINTGSRAPLFAAARCFLLR